MWIYKHFPFLSNLLFLAACAISAPTEAQIANAPYAQSAVVTGISWNFATIDSLYKSSGSDIWPTAWAADGAIYGAWGDGGGFQGDNVNGKVSLGVAKISGTPVAGSGSSYSGIGIWGDSPTYAKNAATFGGKPGSLVALGGVLYDSGGYWTSANCPAPCTGGPVHHYGSGHSPSQLAYSNDQSRTWTILSFTLNSSFLQFGQDNQGALDPDVYMYFSKSGDNLHVFLMRVPGEKLKIDPAVSGAYQYWAGFDISGNPIWNSSAAAAVAVFQEVNNDLALPFNVSYDAAIGRYIAVVGHQPDATYANASLALFGVFEGPTPWGPWATIDYYGSTSNVWASSLGLSTVGDYLGMSFPPKWLSSDGKTMWGVFSGVGTDTARSPATFDSFNVVQASLTTSSAIPVFTTPTVGSSVAAGASVTAHGTGSGLTWSASLVTAGQAQAGFASGSGTSFIFTVPSTAVSSQAIRVTVTSSGTSTNSVYRDFPVSPPSTTGLVGYWPLDEGSGTTTADVSSTGSTANGNTGTLTNSPSWSTGVWALGPTGSALTFNGTTNYVKASGSGSLANLYSTGMTVAAWIKPSGSGGGGVGRIVDKDDNQQGWFFAMNGTTTVKFTSDQFAGAGALTRTSNATIALNVWQHVVATWDGSQSGGNIHVYINGVAADAASSNGSGSTNSDSTVPITIGNREIDSARGFSGSIDDVRVYNRVLSATEIQNLAVSTPNVDITSVSSGTLSTFAPAVAGQLVYTDRTYTIGSLSSRLNGYPMIQTANNDKAISLASYLQLYLNRPSTVYVAYSPDKNLLPAWLNDGTWTQTAESLVANSQSYIVFRKTMPPGPVVLGGNLQSPASNPPNYSNYFVIVTP
jgi:hypothetical protein